MTGTGTSMTPYYSDDTCTIFHGDCREVLPVLSAAGLLCDVALVVADPPYGETSLTWDCWPSGWVAAVGEAVGLSTPVWCFGSLRMFVSRAADFAGWKMAQDVVWEKHNGSNMHNDRFRRVHEHIVQFYRGPWEDVWRSPVFTDDATARRIHRKARPAHLGEVGEGHFAAVEGGPRLQRSVIRCKSAHGDATNPTEKPTGIIEPLLDYSLPPGGVVLDPMMGSGSTLRAVRSRAGCRAIGIELRESDCEAAVERLRQGVFSL